MTFESLSTTTNFVTFSFFDFGNGLTTSMAICVHFAEGSSNDCNRAVGFWSEALSLRHLHGFITWWHLISNVSRSTLEHVFQSSSKFPNAPHSECNGDHVIVLYEIILFAQTFLHFDAEGFQGIWKAHSGLWNVLWIQSFFLSFAEPCKVWICIVDSEILFTA